MPSEPHIIPFKENRSDLTDEELTRAVKQSDKAAFEIYFLRYYESVYRFIWRMSQSNELAKDCAQETFLRLWENRTRLDSRLSLKAYLYQIAKNTFFGYRRREKVHKKYVQSQCHQPPATEPEKLEIRMQVQEVLQKMPDKVRTVFLLNRIEGFKYIEIAEICDISIKTVESRMSKALRIIRNG